MASSSEVLLRLCIAIKIFYGFADDKLFSLSIDCGGIANHTDNLGINWVIDDSYVKTGEVARVQNLSRHSQEFTSLRYFPSQRKSCYVIPGVAKGRKHMIRASFFYGNYDKKSAPPSFDLQFDGNPWATVGVASNNESFYWEVIYAPKRDKISVCLARKSPDQIPFISALEIREFQSGMYETDSTEDVLQKRRRTAFGAVDLVRYPDDPYDRYWHLSDPVDGVTSVARDNMSFTIQNFRYIPGLALVHAITPASSSAVNLSVPPFNNFTFSATYYYIFYFLEVSQAASLKKSRSFNFLIDGVKLHDDDIIPPYQSYIAVRSRGQNLTVGSVISLVNTADASLPPILNAMEIFEVQTGLANGTNEDDMKALEVLQGQYQQLQSWAGDPCLPVGFTWDWLNCSANGLPQVTELHLSGSGLDGTLPNFGSLTALEIIDLSNNSLSGHVPEFLGTFPYLKELNLAKNNFTGLLPTSLVGNKKLKLNIQGNNIIEDNSNPTPSSGERNMKPIMVGISIGSITMFLLLV